MSNALVVIDVQNGFISKSSMHIIPRIKKMLVKNKFDHVIFTIFVNPKQSPWKKWMGWHNVSKSPEIDIVQELSAFAHHVFEKNTYSSFTDSFEKFLKNEKITELYLVGIDTEACVFKTALDAFEKGYRPIVLSKYCASHESASYHKLALKLLRRLIGEEQVQ